MTPCAQAIALVVALAASSKPSAHRPRVRPGPRRRGVHRPRAQAAADSASETSHAGRLRRPRHRSQLRDPHGYSTRLTTSANRAKIQRASPSRGITLNATERHSAIVCEQKLEPGVDDPACRPPPQGTRTSGDEARGQICGCSSHRSHPLPCPERPPASAWRNELTIEFFRRAP